MKYTIKSHPTKYNNVRFRSRLEARYAAFFDLLEWRWEYEPIDLAGWTPDFILDIPCGRFDCKDYHRLFAEVKPYFDLSDFFGHPCQKYTYGHDEDGNTVPFDSGVALGNHPLVSQFEIVHGHGGGIYSINGWMKMDADIEKIWNEAGAIVQWIP